MNLVYIWFNKCRNFENEGFLLNNNYNVQKVSDKPIQLNIEYKEKFSLYNNERIIDSYVILGKNGKGKSTLLDILAFYSYHGEVFGKYLLILEDDGLYYVYYSWNYDFSDAGQCYVNGNKAILIESKIKNFNKIINTKKDLLLKSSIKYNNGKINYYICADENPNRFSFSVNHYSPNNQCIIKYIFNNRKFLNLEDKRKIEYYIKNNDLFYIQRYFPNYELKSSEENFDYRFYIFDRDNKFALVWLMLMCYLNKLCSYYHWHEKEKMMRKIVSMTLHIRTTELLKDFSLKSLQNIEEIIKNERLNQSDIELNYSNSFNQLMIAINKLKFLEVNNSGFEFELSDINKDNYDDIINLFSLLDSFFSIQNKPLFDTSLRVGTSDGEQAYIELLSCLDSVVEKFNEIGENETCILCLDEVERCMHPEWCRILYGKISELINLKATKHKYYIYLTTHSPYIISDFTSDHIITLENTKGIDFNTFGANIHDILNKGMFLNNSMGEFACQCITNLITDLEGNSDEPTYDDKTTEYIINCIGESFIKNHLKLLYEKKKKRKMLQKYEHMTKEELIEILERKEHDQNRN